jgi:hypothetical protein
VWLPDSQEAMRTMPRKKAQVIYTKAGRTPSERPRPKDASEVFNPISQATVDRAWLTPSRKPKGLSPLAQYLAENEDSEVSIEELILQFQEYDCVHREQVIATTSLTVTISCFECGRVEKKWKPGARPEDA